VLHSLVGLLRYTQSVRQQRLIGDIGLDALEAEVRAAKSEADQVERVARDKLNELNSLKAQQDRERAGVERSKQHLVEVKGALAQVVLIKLRSTFNLFVIIFHFPISTGILIEGPNILYFSSIFSQGPCTTFRKRTAD
jgi:hypothetical protein